MTAAEAYRRIIDAVARGDFAGLDGLVASDLVDHNPIPDQAPGREGFKDWMASARAAFPDLRATIEQLLVDGDRVAAALTWHGTHEGGFLGVEPTGRRISFSAFHLVRFEHGQAVEWWGTADLLGAVRLLER